MGNGNLLATNGSGVFELDSATGAQVEQENTGSARFIELYTTEVAVEESRVEKPEFLKLSISPNPFTAGTRIELLGSSMTNPAVLKIYDASGRLVKSVKLSTGTNNH